MFLIEILTSVIQLVFSHFITQNERVTACAALKTSLKLTNTTILDATYIPAASNVTTLPGSCQTIAQVDTALCRVQFIVNTSESSSIKAEAWLPDEWYGRFLGLGNGGLGGCIDYGNLNYGSGLHFASVASDNGHDGYDGVAFLDKPEVINDFAFRAIHVEAVIGKQIVQAYYGQEHHKAYYLGCSTGGRQGTRAALSYPEDFDGIIAGAPATDFNRLLGWSGLLAKAVGGPHINDSASYIPSDLWDVIAAEVLKQCDGLDGVIDGIITEPDDCDFQPETLECTSKISSECLTGPQLDALRKIYQPLYGSNGELIYPRYDPGTEGGGNWRALLNGDFASYTKGWFKYAIYNDSNHDLSDFSLQDIVFADAINPGGIATFDGDMSAFRARGGKFITYHGRQDPIIASGNSKRVYDLIAQTLSMHSLDSFYRLFLIPGQSHCLGGPGEHMIGQYLAASNAINASSHNVLLAMVDWVENGVAPDTITGVGVKGTQRVHCRYPQRSLWNGTGFVCET